jgi:LDH2 family malate/lactate/ureidoglycolate dehydrogenase
MSATKRFKKETLIDFVVKYLTALSVPEDDARIIGDVLIYADLRGIDSHGLHRLGSYYGNRISKNLINPNTPFKIVKETPTTALIDGGNGCGQVVSYKAMNLCIEKAKKSGLAAITVNNSNHFGIAGYYSMMALEHNMIGVCLTNSQPLVAPTYGRTPVLGTNPISVAVPSGEQYPYVLDMATSGVAYGKIQIYEKKNESIPTGWGIDSDGLSTNDPSKIKPGGIGALLPLGGVDITAGFKGYGLGLLVDILCSALSGGNHLTNVGGPGSQKPTGVSHFFMAIDIEAFRPIIDFKKQMDDMINLLHNSPLAVGQDRIYIAGEKEFELEKYNNTHGVPLLQQIVDDLEKDAEKVGVPFPKEYIE